MKTLKLTITFTDHKAGEFVQFEDRIAKHFLAKGWAEEVEPKKRKK